MPTSYARYLSIAVLAVLNSGLGGLRAFLGRSFALRVFWGLAERRAGQLITFLGDRLGVNLYLAAAVALSVRVFHNLATPPYHCHRNMAPQVIDILRTTSTSRRSQGRGVAFAVFLVLAITGFLLAAQMRTQEGSRSICISAV